MTTRRPPASDPFLVAWFEDGPTTMPDRVVDVVADRIGRTRQRRPWRLPWRLPMTTQLKLAAGLAAVLVLAVAGYALLPKNALGPGATPSLLPTAAPTPTQAALATPTPTCDSAQTCAAGILAGGVNQTVLFDPAFSFTVPAGQVDGPPASSWRNTRAWIDMYELHAPSSGAASDFSFIVHSLAAIPVQNDGCTHEMQSGAGKGVADWIAFLTNNPGLVTSTPVAITLAGATGFAIDVTRSPTHTRLCPGSAGPATVVLTDDNEAQGKVRWLDNQQDTWTILDVGGKTVIVIVESDPIAAEHDAVLAVANPIIGSFDFTK